MSMYEHLSGEYVVLQLREPYVAFTGHPPVMAVENGNAVTTSVLLVQVVAVEEDGLVVEFSDPDPSQNGKMRIFVKNEGITYVTKSIPGSTIIA